MSWSNTFIDFAIVIVALIFIAQYTFYTSWWRNAAGRAVVFLAGAAALIPMPKIIWTLGQFNVHDMMYIWTELLCKIPVVFALIWLVIAFERIWRKGLWDKYVREIENAFRS